MIQKEVEITCKCCPECGAYTEELVSSHHDYPDEGQFGVNVIIQGALSQYNQQLPYRLIADRFE